MQFILTPQEYYDLARKGNENNNKRVLSLTATIHKIANASFSMAHKVFLIEAIDAELTLFEQNNDPIHIKNIEDLFKKH